MKLLRVLSESWTTALNGSKALPGRIPARQRFVSTTVGRLAALSLGCTLGTLSAQQPLDLTVGTGAGELNLVQAIIQANAYADGPVTITIDAADFPSSTISSTSQMIIGPASGNTWGLTIIGNGVTIDMQNQDRAFFIASGTVDIQNLTISNGLALGGNGVDGAGGGLGAGGAIFVANPSVVANGVANDNLSLPTNVTLTNVQFQSNEAIGGAGGGYVVSGQGGGGGMGGSGGNGFYEDPGEFEYNLHGGGGGGGFGNGAHGGAAVTVGDVSPGGQGAFAGWFPQDPASGGGSQNGGSSGGSGGGGGGAGNPANFTFATAGGGGGVGGEEGQSAGLSPSDHPPHGGFGGGGGGGNFQGEVSVQSAGDGGWGGGGGGGLKENDQEDTFGTNGGFGGGAGATDESGVTNGMGGFAAGNGVNGAGIGGGGAGLGGAIFVMNGAALSIVQNATPGTAQFTQSGVTGGTAPTGGNPGSAYGTDLFAGGDVTISVDTSLSLDSIGGAGNLSDPNVAKSSTDSHAQGGLTKTGVGTLALSGANWYTGPTLVSEGTLNLLTNTTETGTSSVTVSNGATLALGSNSSLITGTSDAQFTVGGSLVLGAGASLGALETIDGSGQVVFEQTDDPSANDIYSFQISGGLEVIQNGPGTIFLSPFVANDYTGGTTITGGTLILANGSLPVGGPVVLEGGSLQLQADNVFGTQNNLSFEGGNLRLNPSGTQALGDVSVEDDSFLTFTGWEPTAITFQSLALTSLLSVYNWLPEMSISVDPSSFSGDLGDIRFYWDEGITFLGTGQFQGNNIIPVPEPTTVALVALAILAGFFLRRNQE